MLYAKSGWNWPIGSWKEDENEKSLQTDAYGERDDGLQAIRRAHFSSGGLKPYG